MIHRLQIAAAVVAVMTCCACRPVPTASQRVRAPVRERATVLDVPAVRVAPTLAVPVPSADTIGVEPAPEPALCETRSTLPPAPSLVFAPSRPEQRDPASSDAEASQALLDLIWGWAVVEVRGLPAVSEDGRRVLAFEDARAFTGPPQFDLRLVERGVEPGQPERVTNLLSAAEFESVLWSEVNANEPAKMPQVLQEARARFVKLQQQVRARVAAAEQRLAAERWLPMPWCASSVDEAGESMARVDEVTVSLSSADHSSHLPVRLQLFKRDGDGSDQVQPSSNRDRARGPA